MSMPQIDPRIYDAILSGGDQIGQLDPQIVQQQKMAEYLRHTFGAPPQTRMSGRIASAPHWMELLGGLTAHGVAGARDREALLGQQQQQRLRSKQVQDVLGYLKMAQGGALPDDQQPIPSDQMINPRGF